MELSDKTPYFVLCTCVRRVALRRGSHCEHIEGMYVAIDSSENAPERSESE